MPRGNPEARKALALLDAERRRSFLPYSPGFGAPCRSLRCFLIDQRGLPSHPIARAREETRSPRSRPRSDPARPSTSGSLCEAVPGRRRCRIPRDGQAVETAKTSPRRERNRTGARFTISRTIGDTYPSWFGCPPPPAYSMRYERCRSPCRCVTYKPR